VSYICCLVTQVFTIIRLGYSKKGWITGEITAQYIPIFAQQTKPATSGQARLLIVDGHSSHYFRGFLESAREHNIHVICYPSHTTHVFQALNVSLFGPLKAAFVQERDRYEREQHESVLKKNFLKVLGAAVHRVLTEPNIKKAMARAGTWPINEAVVTEAVLAPSLETSWRAAMPLPQPTPVRRLAKLLQVGTSEPEAQDSPPVTPTRPSTRQARMPVDVAPNLSVGGPATLSAHTPVEPRVNRSTAMPPTRRNTRRQAVHNLGLIDEEAIPGGDCEHEVSTDDTHGPAATPTTPRTALQTTSMAYLIADAPVTSQMEPPRPVPTLAAAWNVPEELLALEPKSENERILIQALKTAAAVIRRERESALSAQATMVLQNTYVQRVKGQLAAAEEKQKAGRSKGRLLSDGMPHVLTSDEFLGRVQAREAATVAEEGEKRKRNQARAAWKLALTEWEAEDVARRSRNEELIAAHDKAIIEWQEERDRAKSEQRRPGWKKPARGLLEVAQPKPLFKDFQNDSETEGEDFTASLEAIGPEGDEGDEEDVA